MSKSKTERATIDLIINGQTANQTIRDLEAAARKAKSELRGLTPDHKDFERFKNSLDQINQELENTKVKAGLATSSWQKMKQEIKTSFIGNLGANLATVGLQKISGYFVEAFNAAVKLSDQMADIAKTTGMTTEEVKLLNSELSKIDTRTSMGDLREIAKVGGQFGVAKDQMLDFVKAVDKTTVALGDEFTGGAEQVAGEMSKLRNIFQDIKTDNIGTDIGFISNAINQLAAEGVATGPVVADMANRIGGYGIQVGLTSGQVLGLSATLQELGVNSERGGTAVVKIIQKMLTNTDEFAKIAGVELKEFQQLLNTDLYGAFIKVMEGSKQMGPNASMLANIIKDLEVNGAGASEVFAKLSSNTDMLKQKAESATEALTNTNSITEEFALRNENLAGSVEQLSKEWNQLASNPAMVSFFTSGINLARQFVGGLKEAANFLEVGFAVFTGTQGEVRMKQLAAIAEESRQQMAETTEKVHSEFLAKYKQQNANLNDADLARERAKIQMQQRQQASLLKQLQAEGNEEQFYEELKWAKVLQSQTAAINKRIELRKGAAVKAADEKSKAEKTAREKEEKAAKKAAEQTEKERLQELDRLFKLEVKYWDERIKVAEKSLDEEFKKNMEAAAKKWAEQKSFYEKEFNAILDLGVAKAGSDEERYQAEKTRLEQQTIEKLATLKEGSAQYLLVEQQLTNDLKALDENRAQARLSALNSYASSLTQTAGTLLNFQLAQYDVEMNAFRKKQNAKKQGLKEQLDKGLIDTATYNAEIAKLDAQSEERERQMKVRQAELQKKYAVFESLIKVALAWVEAYLMPWKVPQAVAASAQAALIAATPIPEFYEGGFMPKSNNDKDGFMIKAHANEYMVNARAMRDPFVMNTVQAIETAKATGATPSEVAANSTTTGQDNAAMLAAAEKLNSAADRLTAVLEKGVTAQLLFDDEANYKLKTEMDRYARREAITNK